MAKIFLLSDELADLLEVPRGSALQLAEVVAKFKALVQDHLRPAPGVGASGVPRRRRAKDPDVAKIVSEGESKWYSVPALRLGRVRSAHGADGNAYGFGPCQNCGHPLEETLRVVTEHEPAHWKTHLPSHLECRNCQEAYEVAYFDEKNGEWVEINRERREALR